MYRAPRAVSRLARRAISSLRAPGWNATNNAGEGSLRAARCAFDANRGVDEVQRRLAEIVEAGLPVELAVLTDVEPDTWDRAGPRQGAQPRATG